MDPFSANQGRSNVADNKRGVTGYLGARAQATRDIVFTKHMNSFSSSGKASHRSNHITFTASSRGKQARERRAFCMIDGGLFFISIWHLRARTSNTYNTGFYLLRGEMGRRRSGLDRSIFLFFLFFCFSSTLIGMSDIFAGIFLRWVGGGWMLGLYHTRLVMR